MDLRGLIELRFQPNRDFVVLFGLGPGGALVRDGARPRLARDLALGFGVSRNPGGVAAFQDQPTCFELLVVTGDTISSNGLERGGRRRVGIRPSDAGGNQTEQQSALRHATKISNSRRPRI